MVFFSVLFRLAYPVKPYTKKHKLANPRYDDHTSEPRYSVGFLGAKALLSAMNILDLLGGILESPGRLNRGRAMLKGDGAVEEVPLGKTRTGDRLAYDYPLKGTTTET